jgi:hypothetical protein
MAAKLYSFKFLSKQIKFSSYHFSSNDQLLRGLNYSKFDNYLTLKVILTDEGV